jgi:hypothetical protein
VPWGSLYLVSASLLVITAANLGMALSRLLGLAGRERVLLIALAGGVWLLNPTTAETVSRWVAALPMYALGPFLLSVGFGRQITQLGTQTGKRSAIGLAVLQFSAACMLEQVWVSQFVLHTLVLTLYGGRGSWGRYIPATCAFALAGLVLILSPGQISRMASIGHSSFDLASGVTAWLSKTMAFAWSWLFSRGSVSHPEFSSVAQLVLGIGLAALVVSIAREGRDSAHERFKPFLLFVAAGFSSSATLIFGPYFPERAQLLPCLFFYLALASLCVGIRSRFEHVCRSTLIVVVVLMLSANSVAGFLLLQSTMARQRSRLLTYVNVVESVAKAPNSLAVLRTTQIGFDAPWGTQAILRWVGLSERSVLAAGVLPHALRIATEDMTEALELQAAPTLPGFVRRMSPGEASGPVRILAHVQKSGRAGVSLDFPIYRDFSICDATTWVNPNVGGSSAYETSLGARLRFATGWSGGLHRMIDGVETERSSVFPQLTLDVSLVMGGQGVPSIPIAAMSSFHEHLYFVSLSDSASPLLRLRVTGLSPKALGSYVRAELVCR